MLKWDLQLSSDICLASDCFPDKAASITASNNLVRCCAGAALTGFVGPLITAISAGEAVPLSLAQDLLTRCSS